MPTDLEVVLPVPHPGQVQVLESTARFKVVDCGRRFGKTVCAQDELIRTALDGWPTAWFAPKYKYLAEPWDSIIQTLGPVVRSANKQERQVKLIGGGVVDFWTLEDPDSGRSRKYKHVVIDEAAKAQHLKDAWTKAIRPTLTDYKGTAGFWSTPRGRDYFWTLFQKGLDPLEKDYACWQLPSVTNPFLDPAEIEDARRDLPERVFQQEYLAIFLEDAGGVFRSVAACIDRGRAAPEDRRDVGSYALGVDLARKEDFTVLTVVDNTGRQVYFERFNQISWERQIAAIGRAAGRYKASVIVDSTGVGDPIYERLRDAGLTVVPFVFTAASKNPLIDDLAMAFEAGRLRLMDVPEQEAELVAYEYERTKAGHWRTSAPEGMHDDCVMALALAWHGAQTVRPRRGGIW